MSKIEVEIGDINNKEDQLAMLQMLNAYMLDPMGGGNALKDDLAVKIIDGLKQQTNYIFFIAKYEGNIAGFANCFLNFSTFKGKQLINIHDLAVDPKFRQLGIGGALMNAIVDYCKSNDLCKITLEVITDNIKAQNLYAKIGFKASDPDYFFWEKNIL